MIRYFVSYACDGAVGPLGFGWRAVVRDTPIAGGEDLLDISEKIERASGLRNVTVLCWQRFEDPAEQTGSRP